MMDILTRTAKFVLSRGQEKEGRVLNFDYRKEEQDKLPGWLTKITV